MTSTDLNRLVKERLNGHGNCYGHCKEPSELKLLPQKEMMIGCYACPSGYVSLIVHYGRELDLHGFKTFLSSLHEGNIVDQDIRVATRYNWDLGIKEPEGAVLREAYWRQSYRRTRSEDLNRIGLFLCINCSSFYRQQISEKNKLCPQCRASAARTL